MHWGCSNCVTVPAVADHTSSAQVLAESISGGLSTDYCGCGMQLSCPAGASAAVAVSVAVTGGFDTASSAAALRWAAPDNACCIMDCDHSATVAAVAIYIRSAAMRSGLTGGRSLTASPAHPCCIAGCKHGAAVATRDMATAAEALAESPTQHLSHCCHSPGSECSSKLVAHDTAHIGRRASHALATALQFCVLQDGLKCQ